MSRLIVPSRKIWTPPQRQGGYVVLDGYRGANSGSWAVAVMLSPDGDSRGWSGYTLRVVIPSGDLLTGSKLRLTFRGASSGTGLSITDAYIGEQAAVGDDYDFAASPTQVKVSGSASFSVPVGGTTTTDEILLPVGGKRLVFAANCSGGDMATFNRSGWNKYEKYGADASTVNATGYTSSLSDRSFLLGKIEVWQP